MIRKITLLFLACCSAILSAKAQAVCGFDAIHQHMMATNPVYNQTIQQNALKWAQYMQTQSNPNALIINTAGGTVYEIPVVVHIMFPAGSTNSIYNPTDVRVTRMIDYLNKTYASTWHEYPDSTHGGTYIPLRFKLAQRTPGCASTTGITRDTINNPAYISQGVNSNLGQGTGLDDTTLKNYNRWPTDDYYNIWIVNKIDGVDGTQPGQSFIAGFAYFAGAPALYDGTIMLASVSDTSDITLPHEIGHAMGLYHTFQGSNGSTCPPNTTCSTQGDEVCDTEPMLQGNPGSCPLPTDINTCTGVVWQNTQKNIMNYSNCQDRFTPGQRTKALYNLQLQRASLLSSLGGTPITQPAPQTACPVAITNPSNTNDAGPRSVQLNDLNATTQGGYHGDGNKVYLDKTCTQRANLVVGSSYTMTVKTGFGENCRVYIDYDNNGTFAANELVLSSNNNNIHTATVTVPQSGQTVLTCTPLRMRVISDITTSNLPTQCGPVVNGQAEDYSVYIRPMGSASNVAIALTSGTNPSCINSPLTFTATPGTGAVNPTYKWYVNNTFITGATNATFTSSTIPNNGAVRVEMFYTTAGGCGIDSAYSNTIYISRVANLTASVVISTPNNPGCAGQPVVFTATPTNGGTAPAYQWYVNNTAVPGATNATYTAATGLNVGDQVKVIMTSNATCVSGNANSNVITIAHTGVLIPAVTISATGNPGCPAQPVTATATPVNGGTTPTYQWYVNNVAVTGATNATYTSSTLNNGDIITVKMSSNNPCATSTPVTSNPITISHSVQTAAIAIGITTGSNPSCEGKAVTFTASTTNPGTAPIFDWKVNGTSTGTNAVSFTSATLVTGDVVTCTMTSNNPCVTNPVVTSNSISMEVDKVDTTSVTTTLTAGNNPGCSDSALTYVANAVNMGANPNYTWFVNGTAVANGATFTSSTLADGDILTVRVAATAIGCRTQDTVYSAQIAIVRLPTPGAPVVSLIGTLLVANTSAAVQWYGPNGIIPGATNPTYAPTTAGQYYCVATNGGCSSGPSNILSISLLNVNTYNMSELSIFPNPTNGLLTLDWNGKAVNMKVDVYNSVGQGLLHEDITNTNRKVLDLSHFASGTYFVVLRDTNGNTGTARVTLTK